MKKTYINPSMEVIKIEVHQLMAGSPNGAHDVVGGGTQLAPEYEPEYDF